MLSLVVKYFKFCVVYCYHYYQFHEVLCRVLKRTITFPFRDLGDVVR